MLLLLAGCQPKTELDRIDALTKQVNKDKAALNDLDANTFARLQKEFYSCDSLLQFMSEEKLDSAFQKLQLVDAYIQQFKENCPVMRAEMDSTLIRLDMLKADAETHYISDSIVAIYLEDETRQVERLGNQVSYFKDRLGKCRKDLDGIKKVK